MKDFDEPGSLAPTGLFLGGTKYMVIQGEPGVVIRGKKVKFCFSNETYVISAMFYDCTSFDRLTEFFMCFFLWLI